MFVLRFFTCSHLGETLLEVMPAPRSRPFCKSGHQPVARRTPMGSCRNLSYFSPMTGGRISLVLLRSSFPPSRSSSAEQLSSYTRVVSGTWLGLYPHLFWVHDPENPQWGNKQTPLSPTEPPAQRIPRQSRLQRIYLACIDRLSLIGSPQVIIDYFYPTVLFSTVACHRR